MKILRKLFWFSLIFSTLSCAGLLLIPLSSVAKEPVHHRAEVASNILPKPENHGGNSPSVKAINNLQTNQLNSSGVIYAPRDIVDLTRLVLEANRDQTSHLAHYIERGTTVIVILFSVLAACGAVFGLKNLNDIENRAREFSKKIETELGAKLKETTDGFEKHMSGFENDMSNLNIKLTKEIDEQTELLAARAEIATSLINQSSIDTRMLSNAVKRIEAVLKRNNYQVSTRGGIRGLADLAFAKKRLGDHEGALQAIEKAINFAEKVAPEALGLLNYNAACYASLSKRLDACGWLEKAIHLNVQYKTSALTEVDFDNIKATDCFIKLVS